MAKPSKAAVKPVPTTAAEVKASAGATWFTVEDDDHSISLITRDHGDVGGERAGAKDIAEGRRLFKQLTKRYPPSAWDVKFDVVDEWVSVTVRRAPLTKDEREARRRVKAAAALKAKLTSAIEAANDAAVASNIELRRPFSVYLAKSYVGEHYDVEISAQFGKRLLYHDHLACQYGYATSEQAAAGVGPILQQFPALDWGPSVVEGPFTRTTGNRRPPDNVIEHYGNVVHKAQLWRKSGRPTKKQ